MMSSYLQRYSFLIGLCMLASGIFSLMIGYYTLFIRDSDCLTSTYESLASPDNKRTAYFVSEFCHSTNLTRTFVRIEHHSTQRQSQVLIIRKHFPLGMQWVNSQHLHIFLHKHAVIDFYQRDSYHLLVTIAKKTH